MESEVPKRAFSVDKVHDRHYHRVVVWGDITLIWGGVRWGHGICIPWDPALIVCHQDGIWTERTTVGHIPPCLEGGIAEVVDDHLYLACGERISTCGVPMSNDIYRLDLKSLVWSKLQPMGLRPLKSMNMVSWVQGNRIFLFGGRGSKREEGNSYPDYLDFIEWFNNEYFNNQLVYYDIETNSWNWPTMYGKIPSPRSLCGAFSVSETSIESASGKTMSSLAFIFGGYSRLESPSHNNDLFILNIDSMKWREVPKSASIGVWPQSRTRPSFIPISSKIAVLFGGESFSSRTNTDCWMLNIELCMSEASDEEIWTRCSHHEDVISVYGREGIHEPSSHRIWLVGGFRAYGDRWGPTDHIRELTFIAPPLKALALESAARHYDELATQVNELPAMDKLRCAIEAKARMKYKIS